MLAQVYWTLFVAKTTSRTVSPLMLPCQAPRNLACRSEAAGAVKSSANDFPVWPLTGANLSLSAQGGPPGGVNACGAAGGLNVGFLATSLSTSSDTFRLRTSADASI